ncbi:hypothetical protein SLEP1_g41424 [Rubroshorea leprosula]|uniref:Uncharacterized protein n=1 Tax=Rubroshorea leprosula TaxID=152421 RepID=A0AAV5L7F3_9ROSI|nr:hypothetical protein SLEP1_g41424 [Rubroshorea leprosula]
MRKQRWVPWLRTDANADQTAAAIPATANEEEGHEHAKNKAAVSCYN